jgi:ABC-2 type transport system ATP-binding protein
MLIEARHIRKSYGRQLVLDDIDFSVERGQIVGLLGPNGSGKTTLMRILTTFLRPDDGDALIDGHSVRQHPMEVRRRIGYLPEHNPLYPDMYVREYLDFVRRFYGVPASRIDEVIEQTGLTPERYKKIGQLSKGYRQRVGLAAAIIHKPSVLILDEPTTGLDPNQLVEIRELIKQLGRTTSILLSTHIMQEVEQMAHRVLILYRGRIRLDTPLDKLETGRQIIHVEFDTAIEDRWWKQFPGILHWENLGGNLWELQFEGDRDMRSAIFDWAVDEGLKILRFEIKKTGLEEIFRRLTGGENLHVNLG